MFKSAYNYKRDLDSHMMKNTEWGAAAYLSHSKYGINTEVRINNNSNSLTGYASVENPTCYNGGKNTACNKFGTNEDVTNPYNTQVGYKASTTGNINEIYDMSGCTWEYIAGYMTSNQDKSGFTSTELKNYTKYIDSYANNSSILSYNNRILGDATGEMGPFYYYADIDGMKRYNSNWYDDNSFFVETNGAWFGRGGNYLGGSFSGQFYFSRETGEARINRGFHLVLTPQK